MIFIMCLLAFNHKLHNNYITLILCYLKGTVCRYCLSEWSYLVSWYTVMNKSKWNRFSVTLIFAICWVLNIYGDWVHYYWNIIVNAHANISVCLFTILLYHISNVFAVVNADIVWQEKHWLISYIIVRRCPCSAILVNLVNYCKLVFLMIHRLWNHAQLHGFNTDTLSL